MTDEHEQMDEPALACEQLPLVHELADGELPPSEAAALRAHLAGCAVCNGALAEVMQLDAMVSGIVGAVGQGAAGGGVVQLAPRVRQQQRPTQPEQRQRRGEIVPLATRRRRQVLVGGGVAAAAAAAVLLASGGWRSGPAGRDVRNADDEAGALALARALPAHRTAETRLAWAGAAGYRPYRIVRSSDNPGGAIPLRTLGALERRGDLHGVGALALLNGDHRQAETYLGRAVEPAAGAAGADETTGVDGATGAAKPASSAWYVADAAASPGLLADRAALALAESDPARALELTEAALVAAPEHAAATWNRGLALRELGLVRAAAAAFAEVAAQREAGWADEAADRAAALGRDADERSSLTERVMAAGPSLASAPQALSLDDARRLPGLSRLYLYDALRAASPAQLAALQPLAQAIDAALGVGDAAALARRSAAIAAAHPQLAATYAEILAGRPPVGAARQQYLAALRGAGAADLLIGALVRLSSSGRIVDAAELGELTRLTQASADPWMQLYGIEQRAQVALAAGQLPEAEALLLPARHRCLGGGAAAPAFRCLRLGVLLGDVYGRWQRVAEARAEMLRTWKLARAEREWLTEAQLLTELSNLAVVADDGGGKLALARAYAGELVLRQPGRCEPAVRAHTLVAQGLINQLRFAEARRELAAAPPCEAPVSAAEAAHRLFVRVHLLRDEATAEELAATRAELAALREAPGTPPPQLAVLDHCEGRLLIDGGQGRDAVAGEALLRRSIAAARELPAADATARKVRAFSTSVLALALAERGDGAAAMTALAEEVGVPLPARCALALAVEDQRRMAVARGAAGQWVVRYDEARRSLTDGLGELISEELLAAFAGCEAIEVLARPPLHGRSRLLPEELAWRYLSSRREMDGEALAAAASSAAPRAPSLVVADVEPPAALGLPRLASWDGEARGGAGTAPAHGDGPGDGPGNVQLVGPAATPARVLAALGDAGEIVVHAHGIGAAGSDEASLLALSADAHGRYALTAGDVRQTKLRHRPLVVLAACRASLSAPVLHEPWSLPAAFVYAGARAVVASTAPIPDRDAGAFFDSVRAAVAAGASVAVAVRDARARWLAGGGGDWVRDVLVFE